MIKTQIESIVAILLLIIYIVFITIFGTAMWNWIVFGIFELGRVITWYEFIGIWFVLSLLSSMIGFRK